MESIAGRGHNAMLWLLGLGMLAAWAAYEQPPQVLEVSCDVVRRCVGARDVAGKPEDPLAELPPSWRGPLAQFRYEHLHPAFMNEPAVYREQLTGLEEIPVGAVLELGRAAVAKAERPEIPLQKRDLTLGTLRRALGQLETWFAKSELSPSATLLDLRDELASKVQVPGTQQSIDVKQCTGFVGVGLMAIYLYLTSLFSTLARVAAEDHAVEQGWILMHRAPLGPILLSAWLVLPAGAWLFEHLLLPIDQRIWPNAGVWLLAMAIVGSMLASLSGAFAARRVHLPSRELQVISNVETRRAA